MNFKKGAIALCVSSALFAGHAMAGQTDANKSFGQINGAKTLYTIYLNAQSALTDHVKGKHNYKQEVASIKQQQTQLFNEIKATYPQARIAGTSSLLSNFVIIELAPQQAGFLRSLSNVKSVTEQRLDARSKMAELNKVSTIRVNNTDDEPVELLPPYTGNTSAGEGASVAIISTGIDYTLAFFGGSGVYGEDNDPETPPAKGSYLDALENGAIEFDGFPTDVVAGGWDFSSENYGNDGNPIDQNLTYQNWNGTWTYPTGLGTELASIVHQLAPGAKLYAYKISNVMENPWSPGENVASGSTQAKVIQAIEHALDPNQDGDTSDHLDVALLDAQGAGAFFDITSTAGPNLMQLMIEQASAQGLTIVTHAGIGAEYATYWQAEEVHRNWISNEGSATSAITVGSVVTAEDGETLTMAQWSPKGLVSGSQALKPEIVTHSDNQPVVKISNADNTAAPHDTRTDAISAAARIAAAVAVIKSQHPGLGPVELKALLANTASDKNILEKVDGPLAEIISKGHGIENIDAAVASPIAVWEKMTAQPYVQFGAHEVLEQKRLVKYLTVRNLSDSAQSYSLDFNMTGEKASHEALTLEYPQMVSVPANSSVEVAIVMTIDGSKLPAWPLVNTQDHTDTNLKATELNGYIVLRADNKPELNVGWMVKARPATQISKNPTAKEHPEYLGWDSETGSSNWAHVEWAQQHYPNNEWGDPGYMGLSSSFVNESNTPTTFEAYPVLIQKDHLPVGKESIAGNMLRAVGGGVYDEPMCTSGKKLTIAVNLHRPADVASAKYADKIGPVLFFYDLFHEQIVKDNGWNESFNGAGWMDESQVINQPFVTLNAKGQPATFFIDYNEEYVWDDPYARYTESKLPTRFNNNGTNLVSELCLDELYHHDLDSVEDFDQNLGFHIETDRDAGREKGEPLVQFNPLKRGYYSTEEVCGVDWFGNEYCEVVTNDQSLHVGLASLADGETTETANFGHVHTAAPGEEVTIAAFRMNSFDSSTPPFMVLSTDDNFMHIGTAALDDLDGSVIADVRGGQQMMVDENSEYGTVVGDIKLDTKGFFGIGESVDDPLSYELIMVNTLPGNPFYIDQATHQLVVANQAALDYESTSEYHVNVVAKQGNTIGQPQTVKVMLNDLNDVEPELMTSVRDAMPRVFVEIDQGASASFEMDISGLFVDPEGNGLSYSLSSDTVTSLSIDGMKVRGTVSQGGGHTVTVTASDGSHQVSAELRLSAVEVSTESTSNNGSDSDGGSMGWLLGLLAGLSFRRSVKR